MVSNRPIIAEIKVRFANKGLPGKPFPVRSHAVDVSQSSNDAEAQWVGTAGGSGGGDNARTIATMTGVATIGGDIVGGPDTAIVAGSDTAVDSSGDIADAGTSSGGVQGNSDSIADISSGAAVGGDVIGGPDAGVATGTDVGGASDVYFHDTE